MKIGLDARFLTHPQAGGFKTYTENLIRALGAVDSTNQYVLYLDRNVPQETLPQCDNFTYRILPGTLPGIGVPFREQVLLRREIARDDLDLAHFLCNTAPVGLRCPFIVTLHDVIQVVASGRPPLPRTIVGYKHWATTVYSRLAIKQSISRAVQVITVSAYEQTQINRHLGIPVEQISVTYLAPNPVFAPADDDAKSRWRRDLCRRFNLPKRFLLGVGYEPRKNIPLLIDLFGQIADEERDLGLVLVAAEETRRSYFRQLADQLPDRDRVIVLGSCTASDLAGLYNLAELFIYPSVRESFGLPPLEAMACGAPTLAMAATSIREIVAEGAWLVEGDSTETWANAVRSVLACPALKASLSQRGLQRAAQFSWQRCAEETIRVYASAVRMHPKGVCLESGLHGRQP